MNQANFVWVFTDGMNLNRGHPFTLGDPVYCSGEIDTDFDFALATINVLVGGNYTGPMATRVRLEPTEGKSGYTHTAVEMRDTAAELNLFADKIGEHSRDFLEHLGWSIDANSTLSSSAIEEMGRNAAKVRDLVGTVKCILASCEYPAVRKAARAAKVAQQAAGWAAGALAYKNLCEARGRAGNNLQLSPEQRIELDPARAFKRGVAAEKAAQNQHLEALIAGQN